MKQKLNKLFIALLLYLVPLTVIGNDLNHIKYLSESSYGLLYKERQEILKKRLSNTTGISFSLADTIFLANNFTEDKEIKIADVVRFYLNELPYEQDADMIIIQLVRLLYTGQISDNLTEDIRSSLIDIPLWVSEGDSLRVYWSENHMIMYLSSRYLLEQKFGSHFFIPEDDNLVEKLLWWLNLKIDNGYYEHNSHYLRYTLVALLNLFDYCDDYKIVGLAEKALDRLFDDYAKCFNTQGFCIASTSRGKPQHYSKLMKVRTEHMISYLMLGTPLSMELGSRNQTHIAQVALVTTSYVPYYSATNWRIVNYEEVTFGQSYHSQQKWANKLNKGHDRTVAGMTMGGYAHKDYIERTLALVNDLSLWDHKLFKAYKDFSFLPKFMYRSLGEFGIALTAGSLLTSNYKLWKHGASSLSSLESYFPGKKGYEQIPWIAGAGDVSVLTVAASTPTEKGIMDVDHNAMNNQLPKVHQQKNAALVLYYPNTDLRFFFSGSMEVLLYFDVNRFDNVTKIGSWVLGERLNQYVAVFKPCDSEAATKRNEVFPCFEKSQAWAVVVGNNETHTSFDNFTTTVAAAVMNSRVRGRCVSASLDYEGTVLTSELCEERGNIDKTIIIMCLLVCFILLSWVILKKKRKTETRSQEELTSPDEISL